MGARYAGESGRIVVVAEQGGRQEVRVDGQVLAVGTSFPEMLKALHGAHRVITQEEIGFVAMTLAAFGKLCEGK